MSDPDIEHRPTRRELIGAAAASGFLLGQGAAMAAAFSPAVFSRSVGRVTGSSPELGAAFVMAGVEWSGPPGATLWLRARRPTGGWSPWAVASTIGHGPDGDVTDRAPFGEPIWFGASDAFQVRASEPVRGVRVHFVSAAAAPQARAAAAYPLAEPVLQAGPGQPPIIARVAWAGTHAPPTAGPFYGKVRMGFVHHTDNPNGYAAGEVPAMLFAMYQFHTLVRGWHDIGYNFVIDVFGRIWEAREGGIDEAVVGAQAGGYNQESTGVSVLGTFTSVVPSRAAIDALERLLAWKLSLHGVPALGDVTVEVNPSDAFYTPFAPGARVALPHVAGHRDGCTTDCPGDAFYALLPSIRPRVAALAGEVAELTLGGATKPLELFTVEASAATPFTVSGRLTAGGGPIAGAPIEVQKLEPAGAATVTTTTTAADGSWRASLTLTEDTLVRALHRAAPVTTSALAFVAVAPVLTLALETSIPLRLTGTVSPPQRHVTVTVYGAKRHRVASRRVAVHGGSFAAEFPALPAKPYEVIARTKAGARNVAGSSKSVSIP
jgi:hypothetical protein